jgi:hypothetical protein
MKNTRITILLVVIACHRFDQEQGPDPGDRLPLNECAVLASEGFTVPDFIQRPVPTDTSFGPGGSDVSADDFNGDEFNNLPKNAIPLCSEVDTIKKQITELNNRFFNVRCKYRYIHHRW